MAYTVTVFAYDAPAVIQDNTIQLMVIMTFAVQFVRISTDCCKVNEIANRN